MVAALVDELTHLGPEQASALLTTAQYLSGALTLAVLTLMLGPSRSYPGFTSAFVLLAVAAGAGALLGIGRKPGRKSIVSVRTRGQTTGYEVEGLIRPRGGKRCRRVP
jgi:hypothetical protein